MFNYCNRINKKSNRRNKDSEETDVPSVYLRVSLALVPQVGISVIQQVSEMWAETAMFSSRRHRISTTICETEFYHEIPQLNLAETNLLTLAFFQWKCCWFSIQARFPAPLTTPPSAVEQSDFLKKTRAHFRPEEVITPICNSLMRI